MTEREKEVISAGTILDWMRRAAQKGTRLEIKSTHDRDQADRLIVTVTSASGEIAKATINDYLDAKAQYLREVVAAQNAVTQRQAQALKQ